MKEPTIITFLGTGGGRFATIYQKRATGGIYIRDSLNIHIDPGPGALVKMLEAGLNPRATNGILVSHAHPDHYTDAEILMEGMTCGCTQKRGLFAGSKSVIKGEGSIGPTISRYHQSIIERVEVVHPGDSFYFGDLEITAGKSLHSDPTTVGFNLITKNGQISYIPDTAFHEDIIPYYKGARVLILSNTRPLNHRIPYHLATEDSAHIIEAIEPELALLTHIGYKMAVNSPEKEGEWITEHTGIRTLTAEDFMNVVLSESDLTIRGG
ncbi:MAG: MBL fold metallo-hydrolase [Thermoplasmata archaeon]|nr:MBL fold metallo-hydrolase [Thermoplasmata archaeon]